MSECVGSIYVEVLHHFCTSIGEVFGTIMHIPLVCDNRHHCVMSFNHPVSHPLGHPRALLLYTSVEKCSGTLQGVAYPVKYIHENICRPRYSLYTKGYHNRHPSNSTVLPAESGGLLLYCRSGNNGGLKI